MRAWQLLVAAMYCPAVVPRVASASVSRSNWRSLRQRADFLRVQNTGQKWVTPSFVLLALRPSGSPATDSLPAFGITVTKKATKALGGAVVRNRIRRRLRAAIDHVVPQFHLSGWELALMARSESMDKEFTLLVKDLSWAIKRLGAEPVVIHEG